MFSDTSVYWVLCDMFVTPMFLTGMFSFDCHRRFILFCISVICRLGQPPVLHPVPTVYCVSGA